MRGCVQAGCVQAAVLDGGRRAGSWRIRYSQLAAGAVTGTAQDSPAPPPWIQRHANDERAGSWHDTASDKELAHVMIQHQTRSWLMS
jgi:hypothetical protein